MPKIEREIPVLNPQGLHARPAALFVQIAVKYDSHITVQKGKESVNGKSIMGVLMLGAEQNSKIRIIADGPDAENAIQELEGFLTKNE
jgi:phosphotransferase system HPr (HPr) family protein